MRSRSTIGKGFPSPTTMPTPPSSACVTITTRAQTSPRIADSADLASCRARSSESSMDASGVRIYHKRTSANVCETISFERRAVAFMVGPFSCRLRDDADDKPARTRWGARWGGSYRSTSMRVRMLSARRRQRPIRDSRRSSPALSLRCADGSDWRKYRKLSSL